MADFHANYPPDLDMVFLEKAYQTVSKWWSGEVDVNPAAQQVARDLELRHHVPITIATTDIKSLTNYCSAVPDDAQEKILSDLQKQMAKLPANYLQNSLVKHITICSKIELDEAGTPDGLTYPLSGEIFINSAWPLHHEAFHSGEMQLRYGRNWVDQRDYLDNWAQLDPTDTTLSPKESMAEYARYLFELDSPLGQLRHDVLMTLPGPKARFQQMKTWLASFSHYQLNDHYWADLRAGKVDEEYWNSHPVEMSCR